MGILAKIFTSKALTLFFLVAVYLVWKFWLSKNVGSEMEM